MSDLIARALVGHVHAAAGRPDEAERTLRPLLPELRRRAHADTTDIRFPQELVEVQLAMGLAKTARAKRAARPASEAHWRDARAWLLAARSEAGLLTARSGPWMLSREDLDAIAKGLEDCDRALGAVASEQASQTELRSE